MISTAIKCKISVLRLSILCFKQEALFTYFSLFMSFLFILTKLVATN